MSWLHPLPSPVPPPHFKKKNSKVEQVSEEVVALRLDLERHTHRERRRAAADAAREELLEGRSSTAAWAAAADADAAAETSIRNSKRVLEETFATGAAVLGAMAGQRERLKVSGRVSRRSPFVAFSDWQPTSLAPGDLTRFPLNWHKPTPQSAKRKALDVLHGLGLSDSLLRVIERRQKLDAWLAYGGMAVVSGILFAAWWWLKR